MKFVFVCEFCNEHSGDEVTVEINARDKMLYFVCPKCKKMNSIDLTPKILPPSNRPFPKTRLMR
jgi:transcription elongation factor Elf1